MGPKRLLYTEDAITAACQAVRNGKSLRTAAKKYGVPPSTLFDRMMGKTSIHQRSKTVLPPEEEDKVVEWLKESARQGIRRTKQELISTVETVVINANLANSFKNNRPGRKWYINFMKRHKEEVSLPTRRALRLQQAEEKLLRWFRESKEAIDAVDPGVLNDPSRIFNCDESGFQLCGGICPVLAPKDDKHGSQVTSDTHKQISVLACGNAAGEVLLPLLIFPGQRFRYDPLAGFPEAHFARSCNGSIDTEIFQSWFETAFCPRVTHLQKPVVLFANSHATHLSLRVHELCKEHGIILYHFPSHASLMIQPLDLTKFNILKQVWREEVMSFQMCTSTMLSKKDFAAVLKKAWERGIDKDVVISGFREAGIFPWNPDQFDRKKLVPSTRTPIQTEMRQTATGLAEVRQTATGMAETRQTATGMAEAKQTATGMAETRQTATGMPETRQTATGMPETRQTATGMPETRQTATGMPETRQTATGMPETRQTATEMPETRQTEETGHTETEQVEAMTAETEQTVISLDPLTTLDRLLDLTAKAGCHKLIHYRTMYELQQRPEDAEGRHFCQLYSQLRHALQQDRQSQDRRSQLTYSFDNLPLPRHCSQKTKTIVLQPPKIVGSNEFRNCVKDLVKKKLDQAQTQEKNEEKEEKRQRMQLLQDKREKKKREKKQKEREAKRLEKRTKLRIQIKEKRHETDDDICDSDTDVSLTSSQSSDDSLHPLKQIMSATKPPDRNMAT